MTVLGDFSSKNYLRQISILATNKSKIQTIKAPQLHQLLKLTLQTYLYFFWFLPWWYLKLRFVSNNFWKKKIPKTAIVCWGCGVASNLRMMRPYCEKGIGVGWTTTRSSSTANHRTQSWSRGWASQHQSKERLHFFFVPVLTFYSLEWENVVQICTM